MKILSSVAVGKVAYVGHYSNLQTVIQLDGIRLSVCSTECIVDDSGIKWFAHKASNYPAIFYSTGHDGLKRNVYFSREDADKLMASK